MSAIFFTSASGRLVGVEARGRSSIRCTRAHGAGVVLGAAALLVLAACNDTAVPFYDAPTSVPNSTTGIQDALNGLFAETRNDAATYVTLASSFSRDIFGFQGASPGTFGPPAGLNPLSSAGPLGVWDNEYQQVKQANSIIASLSRVPTYNAQQVAAITGVAQTMKALNFMMIAETHDTLGIPLYAVDANPVDPPYCNKDVWAYIVALLDSGFSDLNTAGPMPLPVQVPMVSRRSDRVPLRARRRALSPRSIARSPARRGWSTRTRSRATRRARTRRRPVPARPTCLHSREPTARSRRLRSTTRARSLPRSRELPAGPNGVYFTFSGQSGDQPNGS